MKKILFASKSNLSFNLFKTILPLIEKECDVLHLDNLSELPAKGKLPNLAIVDANLFSDGGLKTLSENERWISLPKILIHPLDLSISLEELKKIGFIGFYAKPFLAEELASIITHALKG